MDQALQEALEDVATRFIDFVPASELESVDRLFFQIEQAHWFYEDFLADAPDSKLPHMQLRLFAQHLFARCSKLKSRAAKCDQYLAQFREYKSKIPVCGCILLDESMSEVVLVRNWSKTSWGLPKGKINQHESKLDCARRETLEETGYDVGSAIFDDFSLDVVNDSQNVTMFVVVNVPRDFPFAPRVRKEISQIKFFPLDDLPPDQWNVRKLMPRVKRMIKGRKRQMLKMTVEATVEAAVKPPIPRQDYSGIEFGPAFDLDAQAVMRAFDEGAPQPPTAGGPPGLGDPARGGRPSPPPGLFAAPSSSFQQSRLVVPQ